MAVGIPKLVKDAVKETQSGLVIEHHSNLLEEFDSLGVLRRTCSITAHLCGDVENDSVDDTGLRHDLSVDFLFTRHHLEADLIYEEHVVFVKELVNLISESIQLDVVLEVRQDTRLLLVLLRVDLESLREGRRRVH